MNQRLLALALLAMFAAPAFAQLGAGTPKHDERVKKILEERGIKYTIDSDGDFKIVFELESNRTQVAFITSKTEEYRNFEIREIIAPAYKAVGENIPEEVANKLLEDSAKKKLGGWQRRGKFALFVSKIAADADSESLWSALKATLESADEMEQELTGDTDEF